MLNRPVFPTTLHEKSATLVRNYFSAMPQVDTVLVVNSCARGQAVPESDLDFAVLVKPSTTQPEMKRLEMSWLSYCANEPGILNYRNSNQFAHLHLDIIDGNYTPAIIETGEPQDSFELEIGNHICYSAPMDEAGSYFLELQHTWLPYYDETLRLKRLAMVQNACEYDLNHIPFFVKRGLYFQAFDILCKAFREYLQALFIACKTYPLAYNKWVRYQVENLLNRPDLYPVLPRILSVSNIEGPELNDKAKMLRELLNDLDIHK